MPTVRMPENLSLNISNNDLLLLIFYLYFIKKTTTILLLVHIGQSFIYSKIKKTLPGALREVDTIQKYLMLLS